MDGLKVKSPRSDSLLPALKVIKNIKNIFLHLFSPVHLRKENDHHQTQSIKYIWDQSSDIDVEVALLDVMALLEGLARLDLEVAFLEVLFRGTGLDMEGALVDIDHHVASAQVDVV